MKYYAIKKNRKYVKDCSEGEKLTKVLQNAEKYTNKKSALVNAQQYGKLYGKGFTVVEVL